MARIVPFDQLPGTDLYIDAVYESDQGLLAGEPISKLLPGTANLGGFRSSGRGLNKKFVVLYTSGESKDWPDRIDLNSGQFVYYGDNQSPGHELHDTHMGGNNILRKVFDLLHAAQPDRHRIPPFFVFTKHPTAEGARSVQFKGLVVPGYPALPATEDLVAVWKTTDKQRFQNYRAIFTILDVPVIKRAWLNDLSAGNGTTDNAPAAWVEWVKHGRYTPLTSEPTTIIRTEQDQTPDTELKRSLLRTIWRHFDTDDRDVKKRRAFIFEHFAGRIFQMHDQRVIVDEITRGVIDGGRDVVGRYLLGLQSDPVHTEFSLEAKCYRPPIDGMRANTIGVKEVSRLISRIRHRQFGVLVTTSVVARQAYQEVREDRHPIIFICGRDIAEILIANGINTPELVHTLLTNEFPVE